MSRLDLAIHQLSHVRKYTVRLLGHIDPTDWFRQPAEGVTHVAWQVGHLAMAEFRLALVRTRGLRPEDEDLISDAFIEPFSRESVPVPDSKKYPPPPVIREVFERVHRQTLCELKTLSEEDLDTPPLIEHPLFDTKLGSLLWCAQHEMLHAGQIGLLRRLLGQSPLW
jgi:hypothetical protein